MIGVALSGKTTYVKANFDHEEIYRIILTTIEERRFEFVF